MSVFSGFASALARGRRMRAYRKVRDEVAAMPDADLIDMGLKRYQLGHVARVRALG